MAEQQATAPNAATVEAPVSPVVTDGNMSAESVTANVAHFAKLLQAERSTDDPADELATPEATVTASKPKTSQKTLDVEALGKALDDGNLEAIAEALGRDPKSLKVTDKRFIELRHQKRQAREQFDAREQALRQRESEVEQARSQITSGNEVLQRATRHLAEGDIGSFLEVATGKKLDEVLEIITQDLVDPTKRELRNIRAERDDEKRQETERARQYREQQDRQVREAQIAQYKTDIATELVKDAECNAFIEDYGREFVDAVVGYQLNHYQRTGETLSATKAAEGVIDYQLKTHSRFSKHVERRRGIAPSETSTEAKPKAEQGHRGARLSSRHSNTQAQGGAGTQRKLPPIEAHQQNIAMWARQLKAENESAKSL